MNLDVSLNIVDHLGSDEVIRLRQFPGSLPEWLRFILTYEELYRTLKRYRDRSVRPILTAFSNTPTGRLDLKEREMMVLQHAKGYPCGQIHKRLPTLQAYGECHIQGAYMVVAAQELEDGHLIVVMDLLNQSIVRISVTGYVRAIVLTETLIAFADTEYFYVGRLADIDFDHEISPLRTRELVVLSLAGKNDEIAIHHQHLHRSQGLTQSVQIYDFSRDSLSDAIAHSASTLLWDQELWIITARNEDENTVKIALRSKKSIELSAYRAEGDLCRCEARSTGDKTQIILAWCHRGRLSYRTFVLDGDVLDDNFTGAGMVWRGKIYSPWEGSGIEIKSTERIGLLRKSYVDCQLLAINDTFLVAISNYVDDEAVDIATMSFDQSLGLQHEVKEEYSRLLYWWDPSYR